MCAIIEGRFLSPRRFGVLAIANVLFEALPATWQASEPKRINDLVWLVDCWSLVIDERHMADEGARPITLGDTGPRYASIEQTLKKGRIRRGRFTTMLGLAITEPMTADETALIVRVAKRYGDIDAFGFGRMHIRQGTPFMAASLGDGRYDDEAIKRHFAALAEAGRRDSTR